MDRTTTITFLIIHENILLTNKNIYTFLNACIS